MSSRETLYLCLIALFLMSCGLNTISAEGEAKPAENEAPWKMFIKVLDQVTGEPIPKPQVRVCLGSDKEIPFIGDEQGDVIAEIPAKSKRFFWIDIDAPNYASVKGTWVSRGSQALELPEAVTVQLDKSITVGGRVVDDKGQPVEGAVVEFAASCGRRDGVPITAMFIPWFYHKTYTTDADGRWTCSCVHDSFNSATIRVKHPDFVPPPESMNFNANIEEVRSLRHVWTLDPGFTIQGRITDPSGKPIPGAVLGYGVNNLYMRRATYPRSDSDGCYTFENVGTSYRLANPEKMTVTAIAPEWAPQMQLVPGVGKHPLGQSTAEKRIVDFVLQPGVTQKITAKSSEGKPAANVTVFIDHWGIASSDALVTLCEEGGIPQKTDANGIWEWTAAPPGKIPSIRFGGSGFSEHSFEIPQTGTPLEITLLRPQFLSGTVIDAETREPIERFQVQIGFVHPSGASKANRKMNWTEAVPGQAGKYELTNYREKIAYAYRAVADGYAPAESETLETTEGPKTLNFELHKFPDGTR